MEIPAELLGIGVTAGLAGAGIFGAVLRWSIIRNIDQLDEKMESMKTMVAQLADNLRQLRESAVTNPECAACRRECQDRLVAYQADVLTWLRRQDDKADKLLMMIANLNNGQGGVK